jgi:hypothetical protein
LAIVQFNQKNSKRTEIGRTQRAKRRGRERKGRVVEGMGKGRGIG